jgi:hypothetical protein
MAASGSALLRESPSSPLLGDDCNQDEHFVITHLRALGITSSGVVRGFVQMGTMQVWCIALPFCSL